MELNVLVIGMPNVGKSTLLNALRNMGIKGRMSGPRNHPLKPQTNLICARNAESLADIGQPWSNTSSVDTSEVIPVAVSVCF